MDNMSIDTRKLVKLVITAGVIVVLLVGLNIARNFVLEKKCETIDNAFLEVLSGDNELVDFNISAEVKETMLEYLDKNTLADEYKVVICDDVKKYEEYLEKYLSYNEWLQTLDIEGEDAYISPEVRERLNSFEEDTEIGSKLIIDAVEAINSLVHEDNNTYYVYLKDVFFNDYGDMNIKHKGYMFTIKKQNISKPCYFRRSLIHAEKKDTRDSFFRHKMLCYDVTNTSMTLVVKKGLFSIRGIEIAERGEFFSE